MFLIIDVSNLFKCLQKWLDYKQPSDRQVIVEKAPIYKKLPAPKNVIIEYEKPRTIIETAIYNEGIIRADPNVYMTSNPNGELRIVDKIYDMNNSDSYYTPVNTLTYRHVEPQIELKQAKPSKPLPQNSGPSTYYGPWNTTYRTSYTARGHR